MSIGKHVSFDGRYLHGCPAALSAQLPSGDGVRMTFLVNIWLNWKPLGPEIFPSEHLGLLSNIHGDIFSFGEVERQHVDAQEKTYHVIDSIDKSCGTLELEHYTAYYGPNAWDETISFDWPAIASMRSRIADSGHTSFCLQYADGRGASVSPTHRTGIGSIPTLDYSQSLSFEKVLEAYGRFKVLVLKGGNLAFQNASPPNPTNVLTDICKHHLADISSCWTQVGGNKKDKRKPAQLLGIESEDAEGTQDMKRRKIEHGAAGKATPSDDKKDSDYWNAIINISADSTRSLYDEAIKALQLESDRMMGHPVEPDGKKLSIYIGQYDSAKKKKSSRKYALEEDAEEKEFGADANKILLHRQYTGTSRWSICPDVSQDWRSGPPPLIERGADTLTVDLSAGDVLLISNSLWLQSSEPASEAPTNESSSSKKKKKVSVVEKEKPVGISFGVSMTTAMIC